MCSILYTISDDVYLYICVKNIRYIEPVGEWVIWSGRIEIPFSLQRKVMRAVCQKRLVNNTNLLLLLFFLCVCVFLCMLCLLSLLLFLFLLIFRIVFVWFCFVLFFWIAFFFTSARHSTVRLQFWFPIKAKWNQTAFWSPEFRNERDFLFILFDFASCCLWSVRV